MKAKVKITYEWVVELEPKWYRPDQNMIEEEKSSFRNDEYMFFEAMDSLDPNGTSEVEIEEIKEAENDTRKTEL